MAGGRLDALYLRSHDRGADLRMDYRELQPAGPPTLFAREGEPWEQVRGVYRPRRLHVETHPSLLFTAGRCEEGKRAGPSQNVTLTRNWSPPPPSPAQPAPADREMRRRYGGDPIPVRLNGRLYRRRLFIGGVDTQGERRPDVQTVLNVGEVASRWATAPLHPADRWAPKGEGAKGMNAPEMAAEARWVIERLRAGHQVLVHCAAGMNRSAAICCAVLITLEGLSAETTLERVRRRHPWARPDSHHWLALRWLAHTAEARRAMNDLAGGGAG